MWERFQPQNAGNSAGWTGSCCQPPSSAALRSRQARGRAGVPGNPNASGAAGQNDIEYRNDRTHADEYGAATEQAFLTRDHEQAGAGEEQ
jgi:hypothetical protein